MQEQNVRTDFKDIEYESTAFHECKEQSVSCGQISNAQLSGLLKSLLEYTVIVGKSLERWFPEMDSVLQNLSFLCPANRKQTQCDIRQLSIKTVKINLMKPLDKMKYTVCRNDNSLDFLFVKCQENADKFFKFFCKIAQISECRQLGLLAVTLMCMSLDTVESECGFLA